MKSLRTKNFVIVVNNPDEADVQRLKDLELITYRIFGKETGEKGTPHLQGYVQLALKKSVKSFQRVLVRAGIKCHIEVAKGSLKSNQTYCKKEGDWEEWGKPTEQGKRRDIVALYDGVKEGKTNDELAEEYPGAYMKFYKAVGHVRGVLKKKEGMEDLKEIYKDCTFRPWQKACLIRLREQTDRQIDWIVDIEGNQGKTWFAKWLLCHANAVIFKSGKKADIAHAYNYEPIVIFDYTRQKEEFMTYGILEDFKDGHLFSPKYESDCKVFPFPAVLCLSNWQPDKSMMSKDRWVITNLMTL